MFLVVEMFHLRFTPYDISGYTFDFLDQYDRYVVGYEDKNKYGAKVQPHYHIYIETSYGDKHIRDAAKQFLRIPASGRGKNNQYYALFKDWKDKDYMFKWGNIQRSKGFSEEEVAQRIEFGRGKYLKTSSVNVVGESGIGVEPPASKVVRVSDKLIIADLDCWYIDQKKQFGSVDDKEMIKQACRIVLGYGKGISPYKIRDYVLSVWFLQEKWDDPKSDLTVNKIYGIL